MPSATWHDDFTGRVDYAARVISEGRDTSCNRTFHGCFEHYDGDEVAAALVRRAEKNPRLAANLFRYISRDLALAAADRLKGKNLTQEARATRDHEKAAAEARYASWAKEEA